MFKTNDYWEEEFIEYNDKNLDSIYFDDCTFVKCDFSKSIMHSCKFTECKFINCDLSLSLFKSCTFNDVVFENIDVFELVNKYLNGSLNSGGNL